MRDSISAGLGFGPARRVPSVGSMVKACLVLRKVFRSLADGHDDGEEFKPVGEEWGAIFVA